MKIFESSSSGVVVFTFNQGGNAQITIDGRSTPAAFLGSVTTGISKWMKALGFEYLKGRMIYVKTHSELDEIKRLKAENRRLKQQLADEVLGRKIEEVTLRFAYRSLGITPEELKKRPAWNNAYSG